MCCDIEKIRSCYEGSVWILPHTANDTFLDRGGVGMVPIDGYLILRMSAVSLFRDCRDSTERKCISRSNRFGSPTNGTVCHPCAIRRQATWENVGVTNQADEATTLFSNRGQSRDN